MRSTSSSWNESDTEKFISAHQIRPPLWIRLNYPDRADECEKEFVSHGFIVERTGDAIALTGEKSLYETQSYKNGLIEIQDFASQSIGDACDIHPGMYAWDACAGGGGKALHIAARLNGKGAVYASDLRSYKLDEVKIRARRAGFSNVRTFVWNGNDLPEFPKEIASREGFHRVLVDAPCSSSGTWRRNPDGKYRITPFELEDLSALQFSILSCASRAVKKDGLLVYATCSFFSSENESVVNKFLESATEFTLVSMQIHGSPKQDCDTTFTAVMKRS
jgi:16S rRNA (cytosine967-C5)-methyltransferase